MFIWERHDPKNYSGQMSINPETGASMHIMEVTWCENEKEFKWYAENEWGEVREGADSGIDDAQFACQKAAKELRDLPDPYEDLEEE